MDLSKNMLAAETSPYLLQHKDNPVHWQGWSPEVLAAAKAEGKPILLSVGYAACHWCHVMAHESFESDEIAAVMNELFVNIKVDREERPDLDSIYQNALSLLGQQGGWPLTMFLTPDGEPFWGGTYFPSQARYGRPGFTDVLRGVSETYHAQPEKVTGNVAQIGEALQRINSTQPGDLPALERIDEMASMMIRIMDLEKGGTQGAPKFPQPGLIGFLARGAQRTGQAVMKGAYFLALDRMCQGGIYDHLAGGFARYSVDDEWLVPHFEKMLYDNGQLLESLTYGWQMCGSPLYEARIAETADWLLDEMRDPKGGFTSSYDADSEGVEGKFYVWTKSEIVALLGGAAESFCRIYDVTDLPNWEEGTILNRTGSGLSLKDDALEARLTEARKILREHRAKRIWPGWDDKVLTDWNGLAIAGLVTAGAAFDQPRWIEAATKAYRFIADEMSDGDQLIHTYRDGRKQHAGMLDDYAQMIRAALILSEVTGVQAYLEDAVRWTGTVVEQFADPDSGGFFHAQAAEDIILRQKPASDNATPSGNGTMAENLAKLYLITGDTRFRDMAEVTIGAFAGRFNDQFPNHTGLLNATETLIRGLQIVVVGEEAERAALARTIHQVFVPHRAITLLSPEARLPDDHPAQGKGLVDGKATAYVCEGAVCSAPITDLAELRKVLTAHAEPVAA